MLGQGQYPMQPGAIFNKGGQDYVVAGDGQTLMPLLPENRLTVTADAPAPWWPLALGAIAGVVASRMTGRPALGIIVAGAAFMFRDQIAAAGESFYQGGQFRGGSGAGRSF